MVTLSDVATRAGVSISAVSRVLSGAASARVSPATRERITAAARELGYRPNFVARALKSSRTHVIALVVPDVTNAIFSELMRGVEEASRRQGYMVLLARIDGMPDGDDALAALIGEGRVDGALVQVGDGMASADLDRLLDSDLPVVFINSVQQGGSSVVLDDVRAARVATEHLIGLGHRRIGLVNGLASADTARRRALGFADAMAAAGLPVAPELITELGYQPRQGQSALAALSQLPTRPTALVVANVNAAHGVLLEARRLGWHVPEELSIVAIHDTWSAEVTGPPLTTVRLPLETLGMVASAALFTLIGGGAAGEMSVDDPAPELILRESTAPLDEA
ncbi:LacI family DNA-binding transcriptional regulator [soil metagenome]